jgi:hypothetical protein
MGTITGAILSEDEDMGNRASRAPVDLVACLDRSASMEKSAPLVVQTLMFVITQLKSTDRLGSLPYIALRLAVLTRCALRSCLL